MPPTTTTTTKPPLPHLLSIFLPLILLLSSLTSPVVVVDATSLELKLSSDVIDDAEMRMTEGDVRVLRFNYTLNVTGDANHTLALAVCVTMDDTSVARARTDPGKGALVPLHEDLAGSFNVSVLALFVGRALLHVHFVVGHKDQVTCGQPGSESLQELLKVSEASWGQGMDMNVSRTTSSSSSSSTRQNSSSPSSSSPVMGVHSGLTYRVVVLREERAVDRAFQVGLVILVAVINVGMGCKLDLQVIKDTLRRPFAPITGICSQFIVMPMLSFALTQIFDLSPGVALGFFALGCSPGGSASNVFCYLLGGDVSLSITMTFISTVASIGLLPMWMSVLGRYVSKLDGISIPFANIIYSLLGLVAAVGTGLLLKTKRPRWARVALTISKVAIGIFIVFILTVGVYSNLYVFSLMRAEVLASAAILPYTGFFIGGLVAFLLRLSPKYIVTIAVETGIQNTGVAMIVLLLSLDHPESDLSIVAPATSALLTPLPLYVAVLVIKLRRLYLRRKKAAAAKKGGGTDDDKNTPSIPTISTTTTTTTATGTHTNASDGNAADSASSAKENLCTKLFGDSAPDVDCNWKKACFLCGCDLSEDAPVAPGDIEIIIPDKSAPDTSKKEKDCHQFDNLALEKDEGSRDNPSSMRSNGAVPVKDAPGEEVPGGPGLYSENNSSRERGGSLSIDQVMSTRC